MGESGEGQGLAAWLAGVLPGRVMEVLPGLPEELLLMSAVAGLVILALVVSGVLAPVWAAMKKRMFPGNRDEPLFAAEGSLPRGAAPETGSGWQEGMVELLERTHRAELDRMGEEREQLRSQIDELGKAISEQGREIAQLRSELALFRTEGPRSIAGMPGGLVAARQRPDGIPPAPPAPPAAAASAVVPPRTGTDAPAPRELADEYRKRGEIAWANASWAEAFDNFSHAASLDSRAWINLFMAGHAAEKVGNAHSAIFHMRRALEEKRKDPADVSGLLASLSSLSSLLCRAGNYSAAEPLLREMLARRAEVYGSSHVSCGHVLNNLGWVYTRLGRRREAGDCLGRALEILAGAGGDAAAASAARENLRLLESQAGESDGTEGEAAPGPAEALSPGTGGNDGAGIAGGREAPPLLARKPPFAGGGDGAGAAGGREAPLLARKPPPAGGGDGTGAAGGRGAPLLARKPPPAGGNDGAGAAGGRGAPLLARKPPPAGGNDGAGAAGGREAPLLARKPPADGESERSGADSPETGGDDGAGAASPEAGGKDGRPDSPARTSVLRRRRLAPAGSTPPRLPRSPR